jgi:hypothetical protein
MRQRQRLPQCQQFGQAKTRVGPHSAQPPVVRQVLPQIQKEGDDVAATRRIAGPQPQLRHQPHLGQHRQQRRQTRLESLPGVTDGHARLMAVLIQQSRRIQVQRITRRDAGQPVLPPRPQRSEAPQLGRRRIETLEETRQPRRTGDAFDPDPFRNQGVAPQTGHRGQLAGVTEQAVHESQRLFQRQEVVAGLRQPMWQSGGQPLAPIHPRQPTPEDGAAGLGRKSLIGKRDRHCLAIDFELK